MSCIHCNLQHSNINQWVQLTNNYRLCQRKLLLHQQTPILQQHVALWIYFFPEERKVTMKMAIVKHRNM